MSYAEKNLSKGDSILLKANTSWLAVIPKLLICIILCIIGLSMAEASVSLTVTFIVIAAVVLLGAVLKIKNTELALSRKKLIGRLGTFSIKTMDSPLNKINNVSVDKSFFGNILNYSKLTVSTSSGNYVYDYIVDADSFKNAVMEQIDLYESEKLKEQAAQMAQMAQFAGFKQQ